MSTAREQLDALAIEVAELRDDVRAIRTLLEASHIDPLAGLDIAFCGPFDDEDDSPWYCVDCGATGVTEDHGCAPVLTRPELNA